MRKFAGEMGCMVEVGLGISVDDNDMIHPDRITMKPSLGQNAFMKTAKGEVYLWRE
jgi:hypothetical protein